MSVADKLDKAPPYKLLALDGGGIRGVMTLEILREIEHTLQTELGRDDRFVLADYFDYIAGTSTGAIIATFLSLGWRVSSDPRRSTSKPARRCSTRPACCSGSGTSSRTRSSPACSREQIGADTTLGDATAEDPAAARHAQRDDRLAVADLEQPARQIQRPRAARQQRSICRCGSSCARARRRRPISRPRRSRSATTQFVFVDGGVTMYNNPAFQLFLMATRWPVRAVLGDRRGEDAARVGRHRHQPERQRGPHAGRDEPALQRRVHSVGADVRGGERAGLSVPRVR